jgi:hypothetical protein
MALAHRSATRNVALNFSSSGDNTIVSAPTIGPINVYGLFFTVAGATNITFKDSVVGNLSGAVVLTGNGSSLTLPLQDEPYYQIQPGSNLVINNSNAVSVQGSLWYTTG